MDKLSYPPGPPNSIHLLSQIQANPLTFLCDLQKDYGDLVHYRQGLVHIYFVNDPALIHRVLVELDDKLMRTRVARRGLGKFMGQGLLTTAGPAHHQRRQLIQPLFTPAQVATYAQSMLDCTHRRIAGWGDGETRDIAQEMMDLTTDIVCAAIFGAYPDLSQHTLHDAVATLRRYASGMMVNATPIAEDESQTAIVQFDDVIANLITQQSATSINTLLSLLANADLSQQAMRDEAITFFVAGQDTSANVLAWIWYLIAQHPAVEAHLRQEIAAVIGDNPISVDKLPLLVYTTQVIKEALRLYPPAWLIGRTVSETVSLDVFTVQPGATITICPYILHRNAHVFPDPERFIPERFAMEPPKYTYLPFGAGPHVCIGQPFAMLEMSIILVTILQKYHLEVLADQQIEIEPLITLRPKYGIRVIASATK